MEKPFGLDEDELQALDRGLEEHIANVWLLNNMPILDEDALDALIEESINSEYYSRNVFQIVSPIICRVSGMKMLAIINEIIDFKAEYDLPFTQCTDWDLCLMVAYVFVTRYMPTITADNLKKWLHLEDDETDNEY